MPAAWSLRRATIAVSRTCFGSRGSRSARTASWPVHAVARSLRAGAAPIRTWRTGCGPATHFWRGETIVEIEQARRIEAGDTVIYRRVRRRVIAVQHDG